MRFPHLLAAVLSLGIVFGQGTATKKSALDKATLEAYARHLFVWGPQIAVEVSDPKPSPLSGFMEMRVKASAGGASQEEIFHVSQDGRKMVRGVIFDVATNPFEADQKKLKTENSPSLGTPGAPVVIVLFTDFQCPYCREEAKEIRENLLATYPKEVRLYFKDYPIDQIHPWARPAAIAGRCVFRQKPTAFWDYHDFVFENQANITAENVREKVMGWAKDKGIETVQLGACIDNKETNAEVDRSLAEGRALQVSSTPTLFINGRKLPGKYPWPNLKQVIDHELKYQQTSGTGGEQCCEVKLPSPIKQ